MSIAEGVAVLTYGYGSGVFKGNCGDVWGSVGHVRPLSDVFTGTNAANLKGLGIGDNVAAISASALVDEDVSSECVVMGDQQRAVCTIDEYSEKHLRLSCLRRLGSTTAGCVTRPRAAGEGCLGRSSTASSSGRLRDVGENRLAIEELRERHDALRHLWGAWAGLRRQVDSPAVTMSSLRRWTTGCARRGGSAA